MSKWPNAQAVRARFCISQQTEIMPFNGNEFSGSRESPLLKLRWRNRFGGSGYKKDGGDLYK